MNNTHTINRNSSVELLRILAIVMIVFSHFSLHGIMKNGLVYDLDSAGKIISSFFIQGNIGVGMFFAITGFFSGKKKKRLGLNVVSDLFFFSLITCIFMLISSRISIISNLYGFSSMKSLIKIVLRMLIAPITGEGWWFATTYVYLILFISPFLDEIYNRYNKKRKCCFIILVLVASFLSMWLETPPYRLLQASSYYLIGRFVSECKLKIPKILRLISLIMGFILFTLLNYLEYILDSFFIPEIFMNIIVCPFIVIILLNIFAYDFEIKSIKVGRCINRIAESTFGIYLLHDSDYMRKFLWQYLFPMKDICRSNFFVIYAIAIVVGILVVTSIFTMAYIKFLRKRLISVITSIKQYLEKAG